VAATSSSGGASIVVDCAFGLFPASPESILPADNGYLLYSAVSRILPWIHSNQDVGIHPLRGRLVGNRLLSLSRGATLTFRVPAGFIGDLLPLAGQTLRVAGASVQVGTPSVRPLIPAAELASRLVTIRGFQEPDAFLAAVHKQLEEMSISGKARLAARRSNKAVEFGGKGGQGEWTRRTLRVSDRNIVGFAVEVGSLSAVDSLKLEEAGLGGRRRFGCGIFVPARRSSYG
jgi:CRISPR-associated protein Cas6